MVERMQVHSDKDINLALILHLSHYFSEPWFPHLYLEGRAVLFTAVLLLGLVLLTRQVLNGICQMNE